MPVEAAGRRAPPHAAVGSPPFSEVDFQSNSVTSVGLRCIFKIQAFKPMPNWNSEAPEIGSSSLLTGVEGRKRLGDNNTLQVYDFFNPKLFANSSANPRAEGPAQPVLKCSHAQPEPPPASKPLSEAPDSRLPSVRWKWSLHLTQWQGHFFEAKCNYQSRSWPGKWGLALPSPASTSGSLTGFSEIWGFMLPSKSWLCLKHGWGLANNRAIDSSQPEERIYWDFL